MQYASGKWLLAVEGESCVEVARELELVSFTLQGGSWTEADCKSAMQQCQNANVAGILYWPDNDEAGHKKAQKMSQAAAQAGVPFIQLDPLAIWEDMPDAGDIVDWVKWGMEQGWNKDDFIQRLEAELHHAVNQANAARIEEQKRNDPDERLKLEVGIYAKETNLFKKKRLRGRICSEYRISKQDLEELVEELERSHSTPTQRSYSASEFFAQETAALSGLSLVCCQSVRQHCSRRLPKSVKPD
jgi:DNA primase